MVPVSTRIRTRDPENGHFIFDDLSFNYDNLSLTGREEEENTRNRGEIDVEGEEKKEKSQLVS